MGKKIIFFILALMVFTACNNEYSEYHDCDTEDCDTQEPFTARIEITFNRPEECPYPLILIMTENYNQRTVIDTLKTDSISGFSLNYYVTVNMKYVVGGKYVIGQDTFLVLDGKYVYKDFYLCSDTMCWYVGNTDFNVELKK